MYKLLFPIFISLLLFVSSAQALSDLDYLPKDTQYMSHIPLPTEVLGSPVGEWHVRHDQLVSYMRLLAEKSHRVSLVETGRTHENRPLLLLAFTSAANQKNLPQIQARHLANVGKKPNKTDPLVIWMGYSVHGDESSGSNASMLVAYYLAAAKGEFVDTLLNDNVVLLDPSLNPDGLSRFAQWANMHKGKTLVSDPAHREHQQAWPSGRVNHYWFDLNRDWLLLTHPESRARVTQYQNWRPHVLTDFHEMGPNSTFFFQPGIPSRKNPWTPNGNVEVTSALADYHAAALDQQKQLYFTEESYDDFYYGKGSTYPDVQGGIGILFEQASSRGHVQDTEHGLLSFADTIQNQVTTSFSTFRGALAKKQALLAYGEEFAREIKSLIADDPIAGYIISEENDRTRFTNMQDILRAHKIDFWSLSKQVSVNEQVFSPNSSIYVPLDQSQYRLVKSLMSERTSFANNAFYDVSNWNIALAFNLRYQAVEKKLWRKIPINKNAQSHSALTMQSDLPNDAYAYAFSWQDSAAPKMLQSLLEKGVKVKLAGQSFVAQSYQGSISFEAGAVLIPGALDQPADLVNMLVQQSQQTGIKVWPLNSGLTKQGIDLGSRKMRTIEAPKVLLVGGAGTSQYEVGEIWHYLDQRIGMPVTIIDKDRLERTLFDSYTHIIWASGRYDSLSEHTTKELEHWLKSGGVMIGQKSAAAWFAKKNWLKASFLDKADIEASFKSKGLRFADKDGYKAMQTIAGASFNTKLDLSHPLAFGYSRENLPIFRNSEVIMLKPDSLFTTALQYTNTPLAAGYAAPEIQTLIANSAAAVAHNYGKGKVIAFSDNLNFRGYWQGTSRLFSNAIFMASFINVEG